jgi:hypothetical protein
MSGARCTFTKGEAAPVGRPRFRCRRANQTFRSTIELLMAAMA